MLADDLLAPSRRSNDRLTRAREYFASDSARTIQAVLGLLWLLDGALQLQPFMYSTGFSHSLAAQASAQPGWLHDTVIWGARVLAGNPAVWNTLFAVTQIFVGLGLLCRDTVKPALAGSFVWALVVWWFGEAFGSLFGIGASPLTGAPGAVIVYALVGAIAWPSERPGGLLGARGARAAWAVVWLLMAWLWLQAPNNSANAISSAIHDAPSGSGWLHALQNAVAGAAEGNGLPIALPLALVSAAVGVAVVTDRRPREFLGLAIALNAVYWLLGQGLGGLFTGAATDPNTAPLLILFAAALYPLTSATKPLHAKPASRGSLPQIAASS